MFCGIALLAVVTAFLPALSEAAQCEPRAVSLPFANQRLGGQTYMRGVSLGIGTPEQDLSFILCAAHANTYAYGGDGFCRDGKGQWCLVGHGGRYNQSSSTSSAASEPPTEPFVDQGVETNWTRDSVTVGDGTAPQAFEFGVPTNQLHDFRPQAEIGMAVNSTFINALHTAGNISSNSYSLFWGDEFADEPRDGSLTLGGYDESIAEDSAVTKAFTRSDPTRCPEGMFVDLTDMRLVDKDGSTIDLLDGLGPLNVCVVPSLRAVMALPTEYGRKLIESMGAKRSDNETNLPGAQVNAGDRLLPLTPSLEPDSATFKGHLSVTVQNNVTVNFTDDQLLLRKGDPYHDLQGVTQFNASRVGLTVISMIEESRAMARLGGMFFSSAYLMVNHDKNEFSIASARKTPSDATLVGIDTANGCVAYLNGSKPVSTLPEPSSDARNSSSSGMSSGAIAGIAVGTVGGVLLLAVLAFFLWRRRRNAMSRGISENAPPERSDNVEKRRSEIHEAPEQAGMLKMGADERDYAVELDGTASPSELPGRM